MKKLISIYGHSGSYNHGNEAVVRGLCDILNLKYKPNLYCTAPYIDRVFGLDEVCNLVYEGDNNVPIVKKRMLNALGRVVNSDRFKFNVMYKNLLEDVSGLYLFTAEDQYCEKRKVVERFEYQNKEIRRRGGKTMAIAATINEPLIGKRVKISDLESYSCIVARESLTYEALKKHGINCILTPCTAFAMPHKECKTDVDLSNAVAINAGPLAQGNEVYTRLYYQNCEELIKYILRETDFSIALFPHMNWQDDLSDFNTHDVLYKKFGETGRVFNMPERSAPEQKFLLGKCKLLVTVRTHVSIAAYAECVPTLVTGYKTKSIGIAKDIFGTSNNYVMSIQDLKEKNDFINGFKWLCDNENKIRNHLIQTMPDYISKTQNINNEIERILAE